MSGLHRDNSSKKGILQISDRVSNFKWPGLGSAGQKQAGQKSYSELSKYSSAHALKAPRSSNQLPTDRQTGFTNKLPAIVKSNEEDVRVSKYSTVNLKSQVNVPSQQNLHTQPNPRMSEYASTIELGHGLSQSQLKNHSITTFDNDRG